MSSGQSLVRSRLPVLPDNLKDFENKDSTVYDTPKGDGRQPGAPTLGYHPGADRQRSRRWSRISSTFTRNSSTSYRNAPTACSGELFTNYLAEVRVDPLRPRRLYEI